MLTKAQRDLIEECIRKAENGPTMCHFDTATVADAEDAARRWADTWIGHPLRMLLENVDGKVRSNELHTYRS